MIDSVIAAKNKLNLLRLRKADNYDTSFRTHITLAEARHNPPTEIEASELDRFMSWMTVKVAATPDEFSVTVGPGTHVQLLLAGATRPEGSPEYITIEDFLKVQQVPSSAK